MMKVILIGGGGNMKSVVSSISSNKNLEFDGYTDVKDNGDILRVKYLGFENDLDLKNKNVVITITYLKTPKDRDLRLFLIESLSQKKAIFPNIISKCTTLRSKFNKSKGNLFINSCFVNVNVIIGDFNFFNTKVIIEHDVQIGNNNIFSPGVIVGGETKIGNNNFFGIGVVIGDGISICNDVIIGMGSVVTKSITTPGVYYGSPAKLNN